MGKIYLEKEQVENLLCGLCPSVEYTQRVHIIVEKLINGEPLYHEAMSYINNRFSNTSLGQMRINQGRWRLTWNRTERIGSSPNHATIGVISRE